MNNNIHTNHSLVMKCKKNRHLRYVTIKAGLNGREIYIFKYKKTKEDALEPNNNHDFWYGFITPDEIVIVLGSETNRRTMNYAHCIICCEQRKTEKLDPAVMFVIGNAGKQVASYPFDEFEVLIKKSKEEGIKRCLTENRVITH